MDIAFFLEEYSKLSPTEQALFAEAVSTLLNEGLIWREDERRRHVYSFLNRHTDLIKSYLGVIGWIVHHHEACYTFQVVHVEIYHRKRFNLDTTIWLILLRMLYAEQQESMAVRMTRYPTITLGDLVYRYTELPGSRKHFKTSLATAFTQLQMYPLIRAATGGKLRVDNSDQVIELLPPLEVIVPAGNAASVARQLAAYAPPTSQKQEVEQMTEIEDEEEGPKLDLFQ